MKNIIQKIYCVAIVFGLFIPSAFSQTIPTTRKVVDVSQNSPSGTYTGSSFALEGYSRIKGAIIFNGGTGTTPVAHLSQMLGTATPFWFGTNTVSFRHNGAYWIGETDIPILGKYAKLIVGNFGNSTNWQGYLYVTNERGNRFVEAQDNITINNVRLSYFKDTYTDTYGIAADRFSAYNLATATGFVYDDTGGAGTTSGSVAIRGFNKKDISISINSIVDGTVTIRVQGQVGSTTIWANIVDVVLGSATTHFLPIGDENPWNIRTGLNKTGNGTASVTINETYSTKINN